MLGGEVVIRSMSLDDAADFNRLVGVVASEHRYLRFLDAPPLNGTVDFLRESLAAGNPHLAARTLVPVERSVADGGHRGRLEGSRAHA